jgi:hypothetical protein
MQRYPGLSLALGSALEYRTTLGRVLSGHLGRQRGGGVGDFFGLGTVSYFVRLFHASKQFRHGSRAAVVPRLGP